MNYVVCNNGYLMTHQRFADDDAAGVAAQEVFDKGDKPNCVWVEEVKDDSFGQYTTQLKKGQK